MDASALDNAITNCERLLAVAAVGMGSEAVHAAYYCNKAARAELAALRARVEAAEHSEAVSQMRDDEQRSRIAELERAINWAMGCGHADDPFQARKDGQGAYYWRPGLAARATMRYDSHAERYVHDLVKHYEARRALRGET